MKKSNVYAFMLVLLVASVSGAAYYELPETVEAGTTATINLRVKDAVVGQPVIVGEILPWDAKVVDWFIIGGTDEERLDASAARSVIWQFTATQENPTIVYTLEFPSYEDEATFDTVYALPSGEYGKVNALVGVVTAQPVQEEQPAPVVEEEIVVQEPKKKLPVRITVAATIILLAFTFVLVGHLRKHRHKPLDDEQISQSVYPQQYYQQYRQP